MSMHKSGTFWRYRDGAFPNLLAFAYLLLGHALGLVLLASGNPPGFLMGVAITAHALIVGGYLIHELAHMIVFRAKKLNLLAGECVSWLCGAAYAPFERIHRMHMRHHGDRADLALFDPRAFLKRAPDWFRKLIYGLEWLHIPAVELIMHYQVAARPFLHRAYRRDRPRVIMVGISRMLFFAVLYFISPFALLGYAIAYLLFIKALFLADAFAHTYEFYIIHKPDEPVPREGRDAAYDREHTYSNLISERWPWLNVLNLNFGYHTAHHDKPAVPWYRLPSLHRETCAPDAPQILPYRELWRTFHRNRLNCIMADDAGDVVGAGPGRADDFLGVHGVSFLSIV